MKFFGIGFAARTTSRSPCGERGLKYRRVVGDEHRVLSLPVRGAWIEITSLTITANAHRSLPVRGAWIEIPDWGMENAELGVATRAGSVD